MVVKVSAKLIDRFICEQCGSNRGHFEVVVPDNFVIKENGKITAKDPTKTGKAKERYRAEFGDDFHLDTEKWNKRTFIVDVENNRIFEEIIDPETGHVIKRYDKPLSSHKGYGSAKGKRQ